MSEQGGKCVVCGQPAKHHPFDAPDADGRTIWLCRAAHMDRYSTDRQRLETMTVDVQAGYPVPVFWRWLKLQRYRASAVGDIAREVAQDRRDKCLRADSYEHIKKHLMERHSPSREALVALDQAYADWCAWGRPARPESER